MRSEQRIASQAIAKKEMVGKALLAAKYGITWRLLSQMAMS
jgi:hypothetical protein